MTVQDDRVVSSVPHARTRRLRLAAAAVVAACAVAAVVWWFTNAPGLGKSTGFVGSSQVPVGTTVVEGLTWGSDAGPQGPIDITSAHLRVLENTSHATVRLVMCTRYLPHEGLGDETLSQARRETCAKLVPFRPGTYTITSGGPDFGVVVTPTTPGRLRVDGFDLTYWRGLRHGTQHAGYGWTTFTRR